MKKLTNIQFLRFVAAMLVVTSHLASHVNLFIDSQDIRLWDRISTAGSYGVDIFFVISGFVIMRSYRQQKKSPTQFALLRVFRIYPLYALITTLFFGLHFLVPSMMESSGGTTKFFSSSLVFLSKIFGFDFPVLPQGWTLEIEVFFYLIFILSIKLSSSFSFLKGREDLLSCVLILMVVSLGSPSIMFEFILGILIQNYAEYLRKRFLVYLCLFILLIFLIFFIIFDPSGYRFFWIGLPSALLVLLAIFSPQIPTKLANFLGDISYSIYLLHGIIIAALLRFFIGLQLFSIPLFFLCTITIVILSSSFTYLLFEKHLVLYSKNRWGKVETDMK